MVAPEQHHVGRWCLQWDPGEIGGTLDAMSGRRSKADLVSLLGSVLAVLLWMVDLVKAWVATFAASSTVLGGFLATRAAMIFGRSSVRLPPWRLHVGSAVS